MNESVLLTDLYQLTMLQGYHDQQMNDTAVFEFYVRRLPEKRNFLIAAGLEQVLSYLEDFAFSEDEIEWLAGTKRFTSGFLDSLRTLEFTGDVHAMPEGTVFFANEPILRITAPLPQAQLIESRLINLLQFQTMIASKAARCVMAAPGKSIVDFGFRRAHGWEAGLFAARASYMMGFSATATVLAGAEFNIPISGTMAHSFIQAHRSEEEAFENFARSNPKDAVFLIDTYDTESGAKKVVRMAPKLQGEGIKVKAVRIDSGNLLQHAQNVRCILDEGGLKDVRILASGNLDEYELQRLIAANAPVDGFGVGTLLDTSADAPYLECAYKLQEYAGRTTRKFSEGKVTWPGRKQVWRVLDEKGCIKQDTVSIEGDSLEGKPLLFPILRGGKRLFPEMPLAKIREYAAEELKTLPEDVRKLEPVKFNPVKISAALDSLVVSTHKSRF
ncbi:MAG: nicotinate phosphoribosyltransferase [Verrucomicrobiales bacterium]|nr:nicotinate phosphoribosyltransferase [Verrucomicrobiales bacterium]